MSSWRDGRITCDFTPIRFHSLQLENSTWTRLEKLSKKTRPSNSTFEQQKHIHHFTSTAWMLTYISNVLIRYLISSPTFPPPNNYDLIPLLFHLFSITSLIEVRTIKPRTNLTGYPAKTPDTAWTAALDLFRIFTHRLEKNSWKRVHQQFTVGMHKCCENCLNGLKHWNIILKNYIYIYMNRQIRLSDCYTPSNFKVYFISFAMTWSVTL